MSTANTPAKSARIETRVSPEQKELIERAAAYSGRSISEFILTHVEVAAAKVVAERERFQLDQQQSRTLVEALLSAKNPNKRLKQAVENYRIRVESR